MKHLVTAACAVFIAAATAAETYQNPVLRGDYPDPSVVRNGDAWWATATSSEWAPQFPLLRSTDLVNWEVRGAVFAEPPAWASGNFWAPEICRWQGKWFLYYTARKKGGPLAVAVATADRPEGPWTDHGPLVAQDAGSIDGAAIDDEHGRRHLVWKEDGNSRGQPTILWAQPLDESGTRLTGERREILRNDTAWEGAVVEGPFLLRRDGWFHLFYAGNSCCGARAEYAEGVARSRHLLGPWEKCPRNPLLRTSEAFRAPGHGSITDDPSGRLWLLYHAYAAPTIPSTGREMMLDEVTFGDDGWPRFGSGSAATVSAPSPFGKRQGRRELDLDWCVPGFHPGWQWPLHRRPDVRPGGDDPAAGIVMKSSGKGPAVLARSVTSGDFAAETEIGLPAAGSMAGLGAWGDGGNHVTMEVRDGKATVVRTEGGKRTVLAEAPLPPGTRLRLRLTMTGGRRLRFAASPDGEAWSPVGESDGGYLPPWDRAIRTALVAEGEAAFVRFRSRSTRP